MLLNLFVSQFGTAKVVHFPNTTKSGMLIVVNHLLLYLLNGIEVIAVLDLHIPCLILIETCCFLGVIGGKDRPAPIPLWAYSHLNARLGIADNVTALVTACGALNEVVESGFIISERHLAHFK